MLSLALSILGADAVTLSPYMGFDSIRAFSKYESKALFILVKTSNDSSGELQDLRVGDEPLYLVVTKLIQKWQEESKASLGAVVGATYPEDLKRVREILCENPILLPGLGAQGGDKEKTVKYSLGENKAPTIINSSRSIIFADNSEKFADFSREKAIQMRDELNSFL